MGGGLPIPCLLGYSLIREEVDTDWYTYVMLSRERKEWVGYTMTVLLWEEGRG